MSQYHQKVERDIVNVCLRFQESLVYLKNALEHPIKIYSRYGGQ